MYEWQRHIQVIVDEIDACIKRHDDEALALSALSRRLGYSEFHMTRKFKEISGMSFRDYLRVFSTVSVDKIGVMISTK